jgi:hypothetical protein
MRALRCRNSSTRASAGTSSSATRRSPLTELEAYWVEGAYVLYIGKAEKLRRRLDQFAAFGRGRPVGHWGGRLIWQLVNSQQLRVAWRIVQPTADPAAEERRLLEAFLREYGRLPFANLR